MDSVNSSGAAWRAKWEQLAEEKDYGHDLAAEVRSTVNFVSGSTPDGSLEFAFASAEAAEAAKSALSGDWALYTPQQAAAVASALLVQLAAGAEALKYVVMELEDMERRGNLVVPSPRSGETVGAGMDAASTLASNIQLLISAHADEIVSRFDSAPTDLVLPVDPHDTVAQLAARLGAIATLVERSHAEEDELLQAYKQGFGCGCSITIREEGEVWEFHRGDNDWLLAREQDFQPDGTLHKWIDLPVSDGTPHIEHLHDAVLAALSPKD